MLTSSMSTQQISQAQFERLESEWRRFRETATPAKPPVTASGK